MGVIGAVLGTPGAVQAIGEAAKGVAEVFTPNATRRMELSAETQAAALEQMGAEFTHPAGGWFDRFVNGINRLPRPLLAFGTIGLFVYALASPGDFAQRMVGLNAVPDPLWWLLGAVVAFYFGARETHYFRNRTVATPASSPAATPATASAGGDNPALDDWRSAQG